MEGVIGARCFGRTTKGVRENGFGNTLLGPPFQHPRNAVAPTRQYLVVKLNTISRDSRLQDSNCNDDQPV